MTRAPSEPIARPALSLPEFVVLVAVLVATVAVSMDAMLPAIPDIAAEITPDAPNRASLIVTSFFFGLGIGTLFAGPLSDSFGRKPVILWGIGLYTVGAVIAWQAQSLEVMVAARVLQGLGAAGSRTIAMALVRDIYAGRRMAQVMSFVMTIFILAPAFAPLAGAGIIALAGWREIFPALVLFAAIGGLWLALRQPETLPPSKRRPLRARSLYTAAGEVLSHRMVRLVILLQAVCFGILFSAIATIQPIFEQSFDRADSFPVWFAIIALLAGSGNFVNAALVQRLGMRYLVRIALIGQTCISSVLVVVTALQLWPDGALFAVFVAWMVTLFFLAALTIGNLNALAMEPLGHIAGMAASVISSIATVLGFLITIPISQALDGTPLPLMVGVFLCALLGTGLIHLLGDEAKPKQQ